MSSDKTMEKLKRENEALSEENAMLKQMLDNMSQQLTMTEEEHLEKAKKELLQVQLVPTMDWWIRRRDLFRQQVMHLPDLVLMAIFRQMTPEDQLAARQVCQRWSDLVSSVTHCRRSLTLLIGSDLHDDFERVVNLDISATDKKQYIVNEDGTPMFPIQRLTKWNSLLLDSLEEEEAQEIAAAFSNVTQLEVATDDLEQGALNHLPEGLTYLLTTWRSQLTAFKLSFPSHVYRITPAATIPTPFWLALNSLSALKQLTLNLGVQHCPILPILSKIEEFTFWSQLSDNPALMASLQLFAESNASLRRIHMEGSTSFGNQGKCLYTLSEPLRACITSIGVGCRISNQLARLGTLFPSLTSLTIISPPSLRTLFRDLSQLTQLLILHLEIDFGDLILDSRDMPMCQLKSVKALDLDLFSTRTHKQPAELKLGWTMPNVQVIRLFNWGKCTLCGIKDMETISETNPALSMRCHRKIFDNWKENCSKLRRIIHFGDDSMGSVEVIEREDN